MIRYDTGLSYPISRFVNSSNWEAFNASNITGIETVGYNEALFLDPYVYFIPSRVIAVGFNGRILRYTTKQSSFSNPSSWSVFDSSAAFPGQNVSNFFGAVVADRYIYFYPDGFGVFLRYDSQSSFTNPNSWSIFDVGMNFSATSYTGGCYDGSRYVYFSPGIVTVF